ncbi:MAG: hypothetical protein WD072_07720 [Pirellulales bacterium]
MLAAFSIPAFIISTCHALGHVWRERKLGPVATIHGFLLQILHGNTACTAVPRLLGVAVCAEAYGQARSRLPIELLQQLLAKLCSRLNGYVNDAERWLGHWVWVIDGSSCSMADTPALKQAFGQPTNLRHLKQTLGMDVLRTKTLDGIEKELVMFAIAYNLVRLVMLESASRQGVDPDQISFADSHSGFESRGKEHSSVRFVATVGALGATEPRVIKRRPKQFPLMTKSRTHVRQSLLQQTRTT